MAFEYWMYPGVAMQVSVPMKLSLIPITPGETPPPGTTIIPPQTPMAATIRAAAAANLEVARQGEAAAAAVSEQHTAEAAAALNAAMEKTNAEAVKLTEAAKAASISSAPSPPWSVTFTEVR